MRMKRLLVMLGAILILTGLLMMALPEPETTEKVLWEKIPDEEIHTNIQEERATESIPVDAEDSSSEEGASEPGPDSGSECERYEEEHPAAGQIILTSQEEKEIKQLGTAEAGGEGPDGQWLAMSVVMNRVADPEWPDTVHDVIYQYMVTKDGRTIYQFSCVSDGRIDEVEPSEDTEAALERIKTGDIAPYLVAFEVEGTDILDEWFMYAFTYKHHKFYTKKQ